MPRRLLPALIAVLALLAPAMESAAQCPVRVGPIDLTDTSIAELRRALARGEVSSRQLTAAYLARIEAVNRRGPKLRAVIMTAPDALSQADAADAARAAGRPQGPLAGIPILLKDNLDTVDMPTTAGAKALLGPPPPLDGYVTARLRAAGAVLLGKANMSEWATSVSKRAGLSYSDVGGRLHNPYDGGETSGSSNGSAIAASAALAAVTVGSETQGSIVLPSFINSAVGLKPTFGLVSRGGSVPLIPAFDAIGPIAHNVADAAQLLSLMTGEDGRDSATRVQRGRPRLNYTRFLRPGALKGARIGVPPALDEDPLARIVGKRGIVRVLRRAGAELVPMREKLWVGAVSKRAGLGAFKRGVDEYLRERGPTSPRRSLADVVAFNRTEGKRAVRLGQEFVLEASKIGAAGERLAQRQLSAFKAKAGAALESAMERSHVDAVLASRLVAAVTATSAGHPHVTVPAGYDGRTPYGIVLVGRPFSEPKLIAYAYDFERRTDAHRSPAELNPAFAAACSR